MRFITKRYNRYIPFAVNRYKTVIKHSPKTTLTPIDSMVYAGHVQGAQEFSELPKSDFYSLSSYKAKKIDKKRLLAFVLLLIAAQLGSSTAYASKEVEAYKLYAHFKLSNDRQYRCLVHLWTKESNWNPRADNPKSSAYGIPQLLNLKERNAYRQIDRGLVYITKRYNSPCKALAHFKRVGHY